MSGRRRRVPRDADAALRRALLAVLERDWGAAERLISTAVRIDSDDIEAYLALARLFRARGEIGRAIRVHQNLLLRPDLTPEDRTEALAGLAADFRQGGFLRRAIASYEEVLERAPRHATALAALAKLFAEVREYPRAVRAARRLARLEGRSPAAEEARLLAARGEHEHSLGRVKEARRALKRALRKDPQSAEAWVALGNVEAERGRSKAAVRAWKRGAELDPRRGPQVHDRIHASLAAGGRAREFESYLARQIERSPDDSEPRLALARALAGRGAQAEAIAEVHRVLEAEPEHLEARCLLGRLLLSEPGDGEIAKAYGELLDVVERGGLPPGSAAAPGAGRGGEV